MDSKLKLILQQIWCKIKQLENGGGSGTIQSIQPGSDNVIINSSDPANPTITVIDNGVESVVQGIGVTVDNTDPKNPIISSEVDQNNIYKVVDVLLSDIGYLNTDTDDEKIEKLRLWILSQNFIIGEKEIWYFQLERVDPSSNLAVYSNSTIGNSSEFKNKKIAFIGDSITTFSGQIFPGNSTKYPDGDVTLVSYTWWKILLNRLEAIQGVNDSWSGSRVSSGGAPGSSVQNRLNRIDTDTDVCFVFMGTNDFGNSVPLGTIDFVNSFTLTEFTDAYCNMVQTLITNYPTTKFYFIMPLKRETSNNSSTFPKTNTINLTIDSYIDRAIEICKIYGVEYIDTRKIGITQQNQTNYFYDGLHPKRTGMQLISDFIYKKIT